MKKRGEMVMEVSGGKVKHRFMGKSVTVSGAAKLGRAIKSIYLGSGSPTPGLVKTLKKQDLAKP